MVVSWLRTAADAAPWAALDRLPVLDDLARWHADRNVIPFAWLEGETLIGYGEVWEDREEDEAELARLVIAPEHRGRGHGRALARALADEAHGRGFQSVWLRVVPENAAAIRAYEAAGFARRRSIGILIVQIIRYRVEAAALTGSATGSIGAMRGDRRRPI